MRPNFNRSRSAIRTDAARSIRRAITPNRPYAGRLETTVFARIEWNNTNPDVRRSSGTNPIP